MNLRYLEILEAVEQTGSFTGAAKKLHLTQSAISHAVAELEAQTETALFDRLPRGVCLTQCGRVLLEEARGILAASRSLEQRMRHLEEYTPVNIVASITVSVFWLPRMIAELRKRFPQFQVNVRVVSAANAMEILRRGEADIAFVEGSKPRGAFCSATLDAYRIIAACAPKILAEGRTISVQELCLRPLLLREKGSAIRDTFDAMLALAGERANPVWESVNSLALIRAAEAGLGITVLPDILLEDSFSEKKLHKIEIEGIEMENKMLAVWHRDKYKTQSLQMILELVV